MLNDLFNNFVVTSKFNLNVTISHSLKRQLHFPLRVRQLTYETANQAVKT